MFVRDYSPLTPRLIPRKKSIAAQGPKKPENKNYDIALLLDKIKKLEAQLHKEVKESKLKDTKI